MNDGRDRRYDSRASRGDRRSPERLRADYRPRARRHRHKRPPRRQFWHPSRPNVQINVNLVWPWETRYQRRWAPRYRYRQVVYVDAGWNGGRRRSRVEVQSTYRHVVRYANSRYAEVDIYLERVELFDDGYYLGEVRRIPESLGRVRATLYRDGRVRYDRDVFIVGDPYAGFELISTRHYDRHVLDAYRPAHGYRVGVVDLRRERVKPVRYSRLFDPYGFAGYVPLSLLPDARELRWDYGPAAVSGYVYDDGCYDEAVYYGGSPHDVEVYYDDGHGERPAAAVPLADGLAPYQDERRSAYRTERGVDVQLQQHVVLQRIE